MALGLTRVQYDGKKSKAIPTFFLDLINIDSTFGSTFTLFGLAGKNDDISHSAIGLRTSWKLGEKISPIGTGYFAFGLQFGSAYTKGKQLIRNWYYYRNEKVADHSLIAGSDLSYNFGRVDGFGFKTGTFANVGLEDSEFADSSALRSFGGYFLSYEVEVLSL